MTLLESLLNAIIRLEGDALVMHVGEKPYVVTTSAAMGPYRGPLAWGQVELSTKILTADAVFAILNQILPTEKRQELDNLGAVDHDIAAPDGSGQQFIVVAARGGDDVWLELRKKPDPAAAAASEEVPAPSVAEAPVPTSVEAPVPSVAEAPVPSAEATAAASIAPISEDTEGPPPFEIVHEVQQAAPSDADVNALLAASASALESARVRELSDIALDAHAHEEVHDETVSEPVAMSVAEPDHAASIDATFVVVSDPAATESVITDAAPTVVADTTPMDDEPLEDEPERERAVVVPLARQAIRSETTVSSASPRVEGFSVAELLRVAAARGASTVYVVAQSQPMIRADGEIIVLDIGLGAPLADSDVNRLVLDLAPPAARDAWQRGASAEWMCDVEDVGRVRWRCLTFREHRGPGLIFRMIPPRAISADQLGLTPEVQALCSQSEGLVLVAGTARQRQVDLDECVHRSDQPDAQRSCRHDRVADQLRPREPAARSSASARCGATATRWWRPFARATRGSRRPADRGSAIGRIAAVALEAADSGRLVSVRYRRLQRWRDRWLVELFAPDRRDQAQSSARRHIARRRRSGAPAARARRTPGGPRSPAQHSARGCADRGRQGGPAAARDGERPSARDDSAQRCRWPPLCATARFTVTEAYLKAFDKEGLLTALKREGVDTSFAERLA